MSIFDQIEAALADGTLDKIGAKKQKEKGKKKKPAKTRNPNIAKKYIAPNADPVRRGEPHGFIPAPPPRHLGTYEDKRIIKHGKFVLPVLSHYMPEELEAAQYSPFDFIGCWPVWAQHLSLR